MSVDPVADGPDEPLPSATVGDVLVVGVDARCDRSRCREVRGLVSRFAERRGSEVGLMVTVAPLTEVTGWLPSGRRARIFSDLQNLPLYAQAVLIGEDTPVASVFRGLVWGGNVIRSGHALRVFERGQEAIAWLAARAGAHVEARGILRALDQIGGASTFRGDARAGM